MEEKAVRGVRWTVLSYGSNKVLTVATTIALAHLLDPSEFGVVALAALVIGAFNLVNDLGMWGALVLRRDFDKRAQGTVFTIMLVSRALLTALVLVSAPFAGDLFHTPSLTGVLAVLAPTILIGGVTWFYDALLHRELEFSRRFAAQLADTLIYAVVVVVLAAMGAGVWSLVAGQVAGLLAHTVMVVALTPERVSPAYDRTAAREAVASGRGFVVQGGVAFLSQNVDYLAVGRVLGAAPLGVYSMGYRLGELPSLAIAGPAVEVTFPGHVRMRHRGEDPVPSFLSVLRLVALVACPLGVLLSATADPFTHAILGEKWLAVIGPLSVLGIWGAVRPVQVTIAWLLNAVGQANLMGTIAAGFLVLLAPGVFLAANLSGLTAVAWVMLGNLTCSLFVLAFVASKRADVSLARQWDALRSTVVASPVCWVAARLVTEAMNGAPAFLALLVSAVAGLVAYGAVASLVEPGILRQSVLQAWRIFGRKAVAEAP